MTLERCASYRKVIHIWEWSFHLWSATKLSMTNQTVDILIEKRPFENTYPSQLVGRSFVLLLSLACHFGARDLTKFGAATTQKRNIYRGRRSFMILASFRRHLMARDPATLLRWNDPKTIISVFPELFGLATRRDGVNGVGATFLSFAICLVLRGDDRSER